VSDANAPLGGKDADDCIEYVETLLDDDEEEHALPAQSTTQMA
jgi:hypothetical protein